MILQINGTQIELEEIQTLQEALEKLEFLGNYFAVALNRTFIPRSKYAETKIKDLDSIEILSPMQGG